MERAYRVSFTRKINHMGLNGYMDVLAKNKKEAKEQVLIKLYCDENGQDNFYPFYRYAERINQNEMSDKIVWTTRSW